MFSSGMRAWLVLLLVALSHGVPLNSTNHETNSHERVPVSSSVVENDYIVSFFSYMDQSRQQRILRRIAAPDTWEYVPRHNLAADLPSDFALVRTADKSALNKLRNAKAIKSIVPQMKYEEILKSSPMDDSTLGRLHGKFPEDEVDPDSMPSKFRQRQLHGAELNIPDLFHAQYLWDQSFTGRGVKVAVFDTGIAEDHPHFRNIVLRTDWTDEDTKDDHIGHGTFVAGVIASDKECLGFAPDVEIYSFRVFTAHKVTYTSWFLDAFNFAIHKKINILNLSIGGPDFMDLPFVEKVWELSANNIIIVSAIGNDGPIYGTLNNPADQLDVIGVGGIDFKDHVASFSSRGMTTWELPFGSGRVKPDIVAFGQAVRGSSIRGGCKVLSGTSVASPVVAGAVALLASTVPEDKRWDILNPASIRQVLVEGAHQITNGANIYEQGFGKLDLLESFNLLSKYSPRASFSPDSLDLTDCPFMWPYCAQPLYHSALPVIFNVTILNGMGVTGTVVEEPEWVPAENGDMLDVGFTYSKTLWPWTGWMAIHFSVAQKASKASLYVQGVVRIKIRSPAGKGETDVRETHLELPVKVKVIPTPTRAKRVLWDQYHQLRYPSGYFPRDALWIKQEPFDWNGDHPYTNFRDMFNYLRESGFFLEILGSPYLCFNATNYGTLLIVDPEEEFFPEEIEKLKNDVELFGLSVAVFADWYDTDVIKKIKFFDENTKQWWTPVTGGSNIPALNDLLGVFGVQFGDRVFEGDFSLGAHSAHFASGAGIARFPARSKLVSYELIDQSEEIVNARNGQRVDVAVLGVYSVPTPQEPAFPPEELADSFSEPVSGRLAIFGDSSCLDAASRLDRKNCFWLLKELLLFTGQSITPPALKDVAPLAQPYVSPIIKPAERMEGNLLFRFSKVIGKEASCPRIEFTLNDPYNNDQPPVIKWPEKRKLPPGSALFREELFFKPKTTANSNSLVQYLIPYLLGCATVAAIIFVYLRARGAPFALPRPPKTATV